MVAAVCYTVFEELLYPESRVCPAFFSGVRISCTKKELHWSLWEALSCHQRRPRGPVFGLPVLAFRSLFLPVCLFVFGRFWHVVWTLLEPPRIFSRRRVFNMTKLSSECPPPQQRRIPYCPGYHERPRQPVLKVRSGLKRTAPENSCKLHGHMESA